MRYAIVVSMAPPDSMTVYKWLEDEYPGLAQSVVVSRGTIPPVVYVESAEDLDEQARTDISAVIDAKTAAYTPPTIVGGA